MNFHWNRSEIMSMTARERNTWLSQIARVHTAQKLARDKESQEQTQRLLSMMYSEQ